MSQLRRIDVHHHVATEWSPLFDQPRDRMWWSVDNAIRVMDDNGIHVAMLSPMGPLPKSAALLKAMMVVRGGPIGRIKPIRERMRKATRQANQRMAELAASHPDRFGFFAGMVCNAEDAVQEAAYAFDALGADGVLLQTNVGKTYLGDEIFDPLLAELDRRQAVVLVHPIHLPCRPVSGIPGHVADFLLSTVRAATNLVYQGTTRRYPNVRFILTHAGGFLPYAVGRLSWALASMDATRSQEDFMREYQRFYFDVAVASAPIAISALLAFADPTRVLYGSDFPFCQPGDVEFFTRQLDGIELTPQLQRAIDFDNAEALFPRLRHQRRVVS